MSRRTRKQLMTGLLFIAPWSIGFCALTLYPAIASAYFSLTSYNVLGAPRWVGLANYQRLFSADPNVPTSIYNTAYLAFIGVPLQLIVGLIVAILLDQRALRARSVYRTVFFLPTLMPVVASTILFIWILNPQY